MKKNYVTPELEISETVEIVTTSGEVQTDRIPLSGTATSGISYGADGMFNI